MNAQEIDPLVFRSTLSNFPTGVVVVTAIVDDRPAGMVVGSFTSVSLDPPLVAYLPAKTSASYALIRRASRFCINVLSVEQESLCRTFASKVPDKFADVAWALSAAGAPRLEGAVAWIDCEVEHTVDGGDHDIVLGRVLELEASGAGSPLLFFQGGYGGFRSRSFVAPFAADLTAQLQLADTARGHMERLSDELGLACFAQAMVDRDIVIVAGTGDSAQAQIGRRLPFAPPYGAAFIATGDLGANVLGWTTHLGMSGEQRAQYLEKLQAIAHRGWSYGLSSPRHDAIWEAIADSSSGTQTPAIERRLASLLEELMPFYDLTDLPAETCNPRIITAPVVTAGRAELVLALFGLPEAVQPEQLRHWGERLRATADAVAAAL